MANVPYSEPDGSHPCENPTCPNIVAYDDEPYCFLDSPDSGSFVLGYSYKQKHNLE